MKGSRIWLEPEEKRWVWLMEVARVYEVNPRLRDRANTVALEEIERAILEETPA